MKTVPAFLLIFLALTSVGPASGNDWPSWRGPSGDGVITGDAKYPLAWSAGEKILWRVDLPGPGNSSPIVSAGKVFLTVAEDSGKIRSLLCLDASSGKTVWKKSINYGKEETTHKTNPYCAASPVTDGETVYAWHGNAGLYAYDFAGNEKWRCDLGTNYEHIWGPNAASPVLLEEKLLIHAGPGTVVGLYAINKNDGTELWKNPIADTASKEARQFKGSWATPRIINNGGRTEILIGLPQSLRSFDPETGREWWRCHGLGDLCYTNVHIGDGHAVYLCGYGGPGIGVKLPAPGVTGDVTDSHRIWADPPKGKNQNPQRIGSGQVIGDYLYLLNAPGVIQCLNLKTGENVWRDRLSRESWSSMNLVGGKLYVNDKSATTFVIDPNPEKLNVISTNPVDRNQSTNATPAFANGHVYLRTDTYLYAIGEK